MDSQKKGRLKDILVPLMIFMIVLASGVFAATVTKNLWIAITLSNNAPVVYNGSIALNNASITLIDSGVAVVSFEFNVTDPDGYNDINNTRVGVNLSLNGVTRSNSTGNCLMEGTPTATTKNFQCYVSFYYYDNASSIWEITLFAADNGGTFVKNNSQSAGSTSGAHNVTVNSLSAYNISNPSLVSAANFGDTNKEMIVVINNTGNFDFSKINVTPYDLNASLTDFFKLYGNFSINGTPSTGAGFGEDLLNSTPTYFNESTGVASALPHHITGESDNKGNRSLYIYVDIPMNKGLTSGVTYNSSLPWQLITT